MKSTQERVDSILNKVALRQSAEQNKEQKRNDVMTSGSIRPVKRSATWAVALSSVALVIVIFGALYLIRSTSVFDSTAMFLHQADEIAADANELTMDEVEQAKPLSELSTLIDESAASAAFDNDVMSEEVGERVDPEFITGLTLGLRSKGLSLVRQSEEDVENQREMGCEGLLFVDQEDANRSVCVVFSRSAVGSFEQELSPLPAPKGLDVGYWQAEQGRNYLIESTGDAFFN